jgi:hypothetical protein
VQDGWAGRVLSAAIRSRIVLPAGLRRVGSCAKKLPTQAWVCRYRVQRIGLDTAVGPRRPGAAMPSVIGHHDVKDTDHWLASPKREEFFGPLGVTNIRTFVDPQNPTRVAVLMDVADMDALMAAMQSEGAAEAMAYDGVLPETLVILVEA